MTIGTLIACLEGYKKMGYTDDSEIIIVGKNNEWSATLESLQPKGSQVQLNAEYWVKRDKDVMNAAKELWNHRDDKYGHAIELDRDIWCLVKGSVLIELDSENLAEEDIYPYEPESYYLSRDNIYVYKVASVKDIEKCLDGEGNEFFEFC